MFQLRFRGNRVGAGVAGGPGWGGSYSPGHIRGGRGTDHWQKDSGTATGIVILAPQAEWTHADEGGIGFGIGGSFGGHGEGAGAYAERRVSYTYDLTQAAEDFFSDVDMATRFGYDRFKDYFKKTLKRLMGKASPFE